MWRSLPLFCSLVAWWFASDALQIWVMYHTYSAQTFLRFYAVDLIVDAFVLCLALTEICWSLAQARPNPASASTIYLIGMMLLLGVSLCWPLAGFIVPAGYAGKKLLAIQVSQSVSLMILVVAFSLLRLARNWNLRWGKAELRIVWGLGTFFLFSTAAACFKSILSRAHGGSSGQTEHFIDEAVAIFFIAMLTFWIAGFTMQDRQTNLH